MKKFEVGKTYGTKICGDTITIIRRTSKTVWFTDGFFSARIKEVGDEEVVTPNIGLLNRTYRASLEK